MTTKNYSIRMDEELKAEMDSIAEQIGITTAAAVNIFARQFVAHRGFPFAVVAPKAEPFETEEEAADFTTAGLRRAIDEAW